MTSLAPFRSRFALTLGLGATVLLGAACLDEAQDPQGPQDPQNMGETLEPAPYSLPVGAALHTDALAETEAAIASWSAQAEAQPSSWFPLQLLVGSHAKRGRLSGSFDDYARADVALNEAFARAAEGSGPWLSQANVDFSLHRFAAAGLALDGLEKRILIDDPTRAQILGLRGDLALNQGQHAAAGEMLAEAEALQPSPTSAARLAHFAWRSGDYEAAEAGYVEGLSRYFTGDPTIRAWYHLQLGILDLERAELDGALSHFFDANAELSGYYLVEEHIAEVWALQGHSGEALGLYLDIVERTQNPEFMDAVASLYLGAGDEAQAQIWIDRAALGYEAQLERAPAAAYGHALGHYISFGPAPRAVELAELNHELRPNGDAKAALLRAYLSAGQLADALGVAEQLADSPWRTANTLCAAYEGFDAGGHSGGAQAQAVAFDLCVMAPAMCPDND